MPVAKGRNINLYIRATDEHLWSWAERQAAERRLALSQFMAILIERYKADTESDDKQS